jgi:hypothetical protein
LVAVGGCSRESGQFAPVSGVVHLNGKPLAGASVSFEPMLADKATYGPGSHAITGSDGRFALRAGVEDIDGALVGKHTVRISLADKPTGDPGGAYLTRELLPARYNSSSQLTFDVPPGGKTDAAFDLKKP